MMVDRVRVLDELRALFDLRPRAGDRFVEREPAPSDGIAHLYGGRLVAQAMRAATLTVDMVEREPHSLHAYFLRPGRPGVALEFAVERVADRRSFSTRMVRVHQREEDTLLCAVSFHRPEHGDEWNPPEPDLGPPPAEGDDRSSLVCCWLHAFDLSLVGGVSPSGWPVHPLWLRTVAEFSSDPDLHACLIAFVSDAGLGPSSLGLGPASRAGIRMASIDHAIWFHRMASVDEWLHLSTTPVVNLGGRGLGRSSVHTAGGSLVATIAQEFLMRPLAAGRSSQVELDQR